MNTTTTTAKRKKSTNIKRKTHKKMNCSPIVKGKTTTEETCYTDPILLQIKEAYNKNKSQTQDKILSNDPDIILKELKQRLSNVCDKEDCWLSLLSKEQHAFLDKTVFAPDKPEEWKKNPNEWLSNTDILNVLKQYEQTHKDFVFIGPTPIDFDFRFQKNKCVWNELCNFSLNEYIERNVTKIGIIFNLDKHNQSGSHWVSLFIDIPEQLIFYFDSATNKTPKEIKQLVKRIQKQGQQLNRPFKYMENYPNQHQKSNTECGMYSLYFIITMIDNSMSLKKKINLFKYKKIKDKNVEKLRNVYFNEA